MFKSREECGKEKHRILQTTPKALRWKGRTDNTHGREKGTEEDGGIVRDTKENASGQDGVIDFVAREKRMWELHRHLNNRKESLSATYKKNTEANTKVYDLNQKTMQAVDVLAEDYEILQETTKNVTYETEEGACEAMEELDKAQKHQDRSQDEMEATLESMDIASRDFTNCWAHLNGAFWEVSNCWALHEAACAELKTACQRDRRTQT